MSFPGVTSSLPHPSLSLPEAAMVSLQDPACLLPNAHIPELRLRPDCTFCSNTHVIVGCVSLGKPRACLWRRPTLSSLSSALAKGEFSPASSAPLLNPEVEDGAEVGLPSGKGKEAHCLRC